MQSNTTQVNIQDNARQDTTINEKTRQDMSIQYNETRRQDNATQYNTIQLIIRQHKTRQTNTT